MILDPLADMICRIKTAQQNHAEEVRIPKSKLKTAILEVLKKYGYISAYKTDKSPHQSRNIIVMLKYHKNNPVITEFKRISKPGRKIYRSCQEIPQSLSGIGTIIVSTSKGVMSDKDARRRRLGGEMIGEIY